MQWNIPNQLTVGRIVLSAGFFVLLGLYTPTDTGAVLMGVAFVIFVLAGLTDIADGYLARKWNQQTAFGRMIDPICDKVLVVGAFVMLAGKNFVSAQAGNAPDFGTLVPVPRWAHGNMLTCVQIWMPVVLLAREFVVSGLRGYSESKGIQFPANKVGKLKMLVQSFAIGAILFRLAWLPDAVWTSWVILISVWATVLITAFSGLYYVHTARGLLRSSRGD